VGESKTVKEKEEVEIVLEFVSHSVTSLSSTSQPCA